MTTLESTWWSPQTSPDIKYNISSYFGRLSLKKYCRKSALIACSPRFSPSGTWASTTTSMRSGAVLTTSSWTSAMTWGLGVVSRSLPSIIWAQWASEYSSFSAFYKGKWKESLKMARRQPTNGILMGPTLLISNYIYLSVIWISTRNSAIWNFPHFGKSSMPCWDTTYIKLIVSFIVSGHSRDLG